MWYVEWTGQDGKRRTADFEEVLDALREAEDLEIAGLDVVVGEYASPFDVDPSESLR